MYDFPVMLKVRGRRCVIIGGGTVATRRAVSLVESGATVTIVAPRMTAALDTMNLHLVRRPYRQGDLDGAFVAVIATNDATVNDAAAADATATGALVNRGDDFAAGDLTVPAHTRHGHLTLSVHTAGTSAAAAGRIRRQLSDALDPDWIRLLNLVAPYRSRVQAAIHDPVTRRDRLNSMTGPDAMRTLKQGGDTALQAYCDQRCQ